MNLGIEGKVALVAAGSKGIGLAVAKALTKEGCRVSICGRTRQTLDEAAMAIGAMTHTFAADVSRLADLEAWVESVESALGPADILVTNTGGPPAGRALDVTDGQWQAGFDSTVMNVVRLTRLVTPGMRAKRWGRIVHITSIAAKEPSPMLAISSTLRMGLCALTQLQASELAKDGITVNSVLPGHTMTDRQVHLAEIVAQEKDITVEAALRDRESRLPMGRYATAEEVASAVAYLCSQPAAYISGVNLLVDGATSLAPG